MQPVSQPVEIFETQNVRDDDGQVIDSFLIETDSPPPIEDAKEPIMFVALPQPKIPTRLMTGEFTIDSTWTPVKVMPADNNRRNLNLYVCSPTSVATDGIRFSDDLGMLATAGRLLHNNTLTLTGFTGTLYISAVGNAANNTASAPVTLAYWAVTE
jgi:hypothetical protein